NTAPDGRVSVNLFRDNIGYTRRVHRLVMEAFVGPCPEGMEVCHWNDNASDNRLSNLRYDTRSANTMDMIRNGRHNHARKTHCPRGHEFILENLKPISQGRKNRRCLACSRALTHVSHNPWKKPHLDAVADSYYAAILEDI